MDLSTKLLLFSAFVFFMLILAQSSTRRRKRIVFFGDSITRMGAAGNGFIGLLKQFYEQENLAQKFELIASGVDGNTLEDLHERLQQDVLSKGAEVVVVFVGVNDVWSGKVQREGIPSFKSSYMQLVKRLQEASIQVVVCTPAVIGEQRQGKNPLDATIDEVSDTIRNIANEEGLLLVDIREAFKERLEDNLDDKVSGVFTADGVHLNNAGNKLVAEQMWNVLTTIQK